MAYREHFDVKKYEQEIRLAALQEQIVREKSIGVQIPENIYLHHDLPQVFNDLLDAHISLTDIRLFSVRSGLLKCAAWSFIHNNNRVLQTTIISDWRDKQGVILYWRGEPNLGRFRKIDIAYHKKHGLRVCRTPTLLTEEEIKQAHQDEYSTEFLYPEIFF